VQDDSPDPLSSFVCLGAGWPAPGAPVPTPGSGLDRLASRDDQIPTRGSGLDRLGPRDDQLPTRGSGLDRLTPAEHLDTVPTPTLEARR
jgi:hypothetical protein